MNQLTRMAIATAASLSVFAVTPQGASAESDPTVTEKLLDIMREQGTIDDAQYGDLKREAEAERQAAGLPPVPPNPSQADPQGFKAYWKDGFRVERNDGGIKMKFGGRIQVDFAGHGADGDVDDTFLPDMVDVDGTGVDFRRARLFMSGSFGDHGIFKAQYDFSGQDADFNDVWAGLRKLPVVGTLKLGHFKEPASLEEQTSSKYITFLERGLPNVFSPGRNTGIGINNTAYEGRATWALGVFRDVGSSGEDIDNSGDFNVTGRVTGTPIFEDGGKKLVHVGGWYSHQFRDGETLRYRARPEANSVTRLIDTGNLRIDAVDLVGGEIAVVSGPFAAQAEYIHSFVDRDQGSADFGGHYIQASYFLTGESRPYKNGAFGRVKPTEPFALSSDEWGAWQVAARWSQLDLNHGDLRGGSQNDYTFALNWYLYSNLRFMMNYVLANVNGAGQAHIGQARVSLDF